MHGVLLRPDGSSLSIPQADKADITLPGGEVYRGVQLMDNYGQHYWCYLLFLEGRSPTSGTPRVFRPSAEQKKPNLC